MTNDCRELVVEPHPALIKVEPWAARLGGAGALLVHAVGNRGVLSFILADKEGPTIIANSAETELVVAIDGKCGSRCQAAEKQEEEQEQRTCCDCAVDRVRGCVGHGCSLSLVRRTGRLRRVG